MNEKGKDLIFYNKPSAGLHGLLHMVFTCTQFGTASTLVLDLHTHMLVVPAAAWVEGRRVHVLRFVLLCPFE